MMAEQQALLMLDDGICFTGITCGAAGEAMGEVVFTTGMSGYQETLTDPSYHGQIVTFTAAHLGNYGACPQDDESGYGGADASLFGGTLPAHAGGAVFHDLFSGVGGGVGDGAFPQWRAAESLDQRLARAGITGISGVDTRALTLHLREHGARMGIISALDTDRPSLLRRARELPPMQGRELVREVACLQPYAFRPSPADKDAERFAGLQHGEASLPLRAARLPVAVIDCGVKRSILRQLVRYGMQPTVWPATADAADILASGAAGVLISNGPGDPEPCTYVIDAAKKLLGRLPLFGICLGHQILALAMGARIYKLPFGHHGINHPVKDLATGRVWITSQNHGFCVDPDSLPKAAGGLVPSHWNLNDGTLEGLECPEQQAFSVQFHPEAAPGPGDASGLFSRFYNLLLQRNLHAKM